MFVRFIRVHSGSGGYHLGRPRGRPVNSGSRGFKQALLGVVVFIRVRVVSLGGPRCLRVDLDTRGLTRARLAFFGFILVRVASLGRAEGFSSSFCFTCRALRIVDWFILFRVGSLRRDRGYGVHWGSRRFTREIGSLSLLVFAWGHSAAPRDRTIISGSR